MMEEKNIRETFGPQSARVERAPVERAPVDSEEHEVSAGKPTEADVSSATSYGATTSIPASAVVQGGELAARKVESTETVDLFSRTSATGASSHPGAISRPENTLRPGDLLGVYRIDQQIGAGGMGVVYRAFHQHLRKTVALKVLSPVWGSRAESAERFWREMRVIGQCEHVGIVRALDAGESGGVMYLAMEYVDGEDLQSRLERTGPLEIGLVVDIAFASALALEAAHGLGIIHRDIKPSNFLLSRRNEVKLTDLGLARWQAEQFVPAVGITVPGAAFGTPDFMSPEQWRDPAIADCRSDLYSLGCTLFLLLTGEPPYGSKAHPSLGAKMQAHLAAPIPFVRSRRPEVPTALDAIIRQLLEKSPDCRFQSARELATALQTVHTTPRNGISSPPLRVGIPQLLRSPHGRFVGNLALGLIFAGLIATAVIVLKITSRDGTTTTIEIPPGSQIELSASPAAPGRAGKSLLGQLRSRWRVTIRDPKGATSDQLPTEELSSSEFRIIGITTRINEVYEPKYVDEVVVPFLGASQDLTSVDGVTSVRLTEAQLASLSKTGFAGRVTSLKGCLIPLTNRTLQLLAENFPTLETVTLDATDAPHESLLREIAQLRALRSLWLWNLEQRLEAFPWCPTPTTGIHLEFLGVYQCERQPTEFWNQVATIPTLRSVFVKSCDFRDADLAVLANAPELESLELIATQISDRGLEHLSSMKSLRRVWLRGDGLTSKGMRQFAVSHPGLRVHYW